jgi:hypothetical protein
VEINIHQIWDILYVLKGSDNGANAQNHWVPGLCLASRILNN